MKTPNDYPLIKFRPGKMIEHLSTRSSEQTDSAYSQTAKQDLTDYYQLLEMCLPAFTSAERDVLRQALNGWLPEPEKLSRFWLEVEAVCDDLAFVERIKQLHPFECWCIAQAFRTGAL